MHTSPAADAAISWQQADDDVFVATSDGEYAGFVATASNGVEAHGPQGEHLGVFATSRLARAAVVAAPTRPTPTAPSALHHRPRRFLRRGTTGRACGPKE